MALVGWLAGRAGGWLVSRCTNRYELERYLLLLRNACSESRPKEDHQPIFVWPHHLACDFACLSPFSPIDIIACCVLQNLKQIHPDTPPSVYGQTRVFVVLAPEALCVCSR